ncbi:MAG: ring-1 2-phenylacetyl-CoA epoxidase subunit PaaC [Chitinophagaceae bacterium]|nr:MAG: ring-1 2-phenylacetyl-CoA epoxidase subunit [Chitinophagaceae bacterium]TXT34851.1 MAG: ring-1 2-phenylacetyl-CoA epoxidase subunit PaaC [Chitinophagaceae bacterium]
MKNTEQINQLLHLADNALIIGHRNSEWCGHGPILEQDIAISNIALDYIGQARNFYQYAATCINGNATDTKPATEDSLAYLRDVRDFKNHLITELPNGDWAQTNLRIFLFSTYQYFLYQQLQQDADAQIGAIAEKSLKEVTYHVRWAGDWVIRLGDGTEESKARMMNAVDYLWPYTGELFLDTPTSIQQQWLQKVTAVFEEAGLVIPTNTWAQKGGKEGNHTEHLGYILAEMQYIQRAYPNSEW